MGVTRTSDVGGSGAGDRGVLTRGGGARRALAAACQGVAHLSRRCGVGDLRGRDVAGAVAVVLGQVLHQRRHGAALGVDAERRVVGLHTEAQAVAEEAESVT